MAEAKLTVDISDQVIAYIRDVVEPRIRELADALEAARAERDQAHAAGYAEAVEALRSSSTYKLWHRQQFATTGVDYPRWWTSARHMLADYLEAVPTLGAPIDEDTLAERLRSVDPETFRRESLGEWPLDAQPVVGGQPEQKETGE